jgi:hypothetical protein
VKTWQRSKKLEDVRPGHGDRFWMTQVTQGESGVKNHHVASVFGLTQKEVTERAALIELGPELLDAATFVFDQHNKDKELGQGCPCHLCYVVLKASRAGVRS